MKCCMKKIISILLFCIFNITVNAVCASVINIDKQTGKAGDRISFTVSARDVSNTVNALGFEVLYDATVLQFQGFDAGSLTRGFTHFSANNTDFGTVRIGGFDAGKNQIPEGSSGTLVRLDFEVVEGKDCTLQIRNLMDDVKGWTVGDGYFSGISEQEEKEEEEIETVNDDRPDKMENQESVNGEDIKPIPVMNKYTLEKTAAPSYDSKTISSQKQDTENIRDFMPKIGKHENSKQNKVESRVKSEISKEPNRQNIHKTGEKVSAQVQKEPEKKNGKPGLESVSRTAIIPDLEKEDRSLNVKHNNPGTGMWHWLILAVLVLILAILTGILWQIARIKQIMKRR